MSEKAKHWLSSSAIALLVTVAGYLILAGSTYGELKTKVDLHDTQLNDPKDGLVPTVNRIGQEVHDLHEWAKPR